MSSGAQVDLDWAGADAAQGGAAAPAASALNTGAAGTAYLTDEEILGIEPPSPKGGFGGGGNDNAVRSGARLNSEPDARGGRKTKIRRLKPAPLGECLCGCRRWLAIRRMAGRRSSFGASIRNFARRFLLRRRRGRLRNCCLEGCGMFCR